MEYINNIKTGFSVQINKETGDFQGVLRNSPCHYKDMSFSGNINTMDYDKKLKIESILEGAFPSLTGKKFIKAYETLLPKFEGYIILV